MAKIAHAWIGGALAMAAHGVAWAQPTSQETMLSGQAQAGQIVFESITLSNPVEFRGTCTVANGYLTIRTFTATPDQVEAGSIPRNTMTIPCPTPPSFPGDTPISLPSDPDRRNLTFQLDGSQLRGGPARVRIELRRAPAEERRPRR